MFLQKFAFGQADLFYNISLLNNLHKNTITITQCQTVLDHIFNTTINPFSKLLSWLMTLVYIYSLSVNFFLVRVQVKHQSITLHNAHTHTYSQQVLIYHRYTLFSYLMLQTHSLYWSFRFFSLHHICPLHSPATILNLSAQPVYPAGSPLLWRLTVLLQPSSLALPIPHFCPAISQGAFLIIVSLHVPGIC